MKPVKLSSLAKITISTDNHSEKNLVELWDPLTNYRNEINLNNIEKLSDIEQTLSKIRSSKAPLSIDEEDYQYWSNMGWRISLDYYLASRANGSELLDVDSPKTQPSRLDIDKYSKIEALLKRKTARWFIKKALCEKIFIKKLATIVNDLPTPLKMDVVIYNINKIEPGAYFYDVRNHFLCQLSAEDHSNKMCELLQGMEAPKNALCTIILAADVDKAQEMYPTERGLRWLYTEAGRFAQKAIISFEQINISSLVTPALSDEAVSKLLHLNESNMIPLYSITMGYCKDNDH